MADIGGDGTTTGQKLEGFQIGLHAESLRVMASTVRLFRLTAAAHSRLRGTTSRSSQNMHGTDEYAMEDRDDG